MTGPGPIWSRTAAIITGDVGQIPVGEPDVGADGLHRDVDRAGAGPAESGGATTWSSVVQNDTYAGPRGVSSPALSRLRRALSGASC